MDYFERLKSLMYKLPEETAHHAAILALKTGLLPAQTGVGHPSLETSLWGLHFKNPVGLAAGFDKNAAALKGLKQQGFGFIEAGTVTPKPQSGNKKPRLFRVEQAQAIVNRMGFNNHGATSFIAHLNRRPKDVVIGANIGKNKSSEGFKDYITLLQSVWGKCDYVTVNISSPNTPGLRALQKKEALAELLAALAEQKKILTKRTKTIVPVLVKIAPDIQDDELESIAELSLEYSLDGLIISNTTIQHSHTEQGGLSGKPLFELSTQVLAKIYRLTKGQIPLIGVGGISSADDAYQKILHGASLVQVYSALIFQGFSLVSRINEGLIERLYRDGFKNIKDAIGQAS